jgi:hypothetical protein
MRQPRTQRSEAPFAKQYVLLNRRVVADGWWARSWSMDGGNAISLLPVLWMYAHGHEDHQATVRSRTLAQLAGLGRKGMYAAMATVHDSGLMEWAGWRENRLISFRVRPGVFTAKPQSGFYVPGSLVADGTWAALSPGERCVLIALASAARRKDFHSEDDSMEGEAFYSWLHGHRAISLASNERFVEENEGAFDYEWEAVRRLACMSGLALASKTGMHPASVSRAVTKLVAREPSILSIYETPHKRYYLLPPAVWANTAFNEQISDAK